MGRGLLGRTLLLVVDTVPSWCNNKLDSRRHSLQTEPLRLSEESRLACLMEFYFPRIKKEIVNGKVCKLQPNYSTME